LREWVKATRLIGEATARILQGLRSVLTSEQSSRQHAELLAKMDNQFVDRENQTNNLLVSARLNAAAARINASALEPFKHVPGQLVAMSERANRQHAEILDNMATQFAHRDAQITDLLVAAQLNKEASRMNAAASDSFKHALIQLDQHLKSIEIGLTSYLASEEKSSARLAGLEMLIESMQSSLDQTDSGTLTIGRISVKSPDVRQLRYMAASARRKANRAQVFEYSDDAELVLMGALSETFTQRSVIDIGANRGEQSWFFHAMGLSVYAFEPNAELYESLCSEARRVKNFYAFNQAVSNAVGTAVLRRVIGDEHVETSLSLYSSIISHSLPAGWVFDEGLPVVTTTLAEAHLRGDLPEEAGLLKIDAEGGDLEVVEGIDRARYEFVVIEFWQEGHVFANENTAQRTRTALGILEDLGYRQAVALQRENGSVLAEPVTNFNACVKGSWGNIVLAREESGVGLVQDTIRRMFGVQIPAGNHNESNI